MSRRKFLRSLGAATALPFLPSLVSDAEAQDHSYERVLFVAWSHGVHPRLWQPTTPGFRDVGTRVRSASLSDATLGQYMNGLFDGLEGKMSIVRGLGMVGAWGHTLSMLTGGERGPDQNNRVTSTQPTSIDNVLAQQIYRSTPAVDVLRLSTSGLGSTHSFIDHNWVAAVDSNTAFAQLFSEGFPGAEPAEPAGPSDAELALLRRRTVVQRSLNRYRHLRSSHRLSAADARRLDASVGQYASLLANLEARIAEFERGMAPVDTNNCSSFSVTGSDDSEAMMREHVQLFTQGFACGSTRVGYWKLNSSHADTDGAHQASSNRNMNGDGIYSRTMRSNCRHIAELMRAFDSVEEANGRTMLDNTLIVACSDLASSLNEHNGADAPFLLAGGLGGKFRMGEFIDYADYEHRVDGGHDFQLYGGPPHTELLTSILRAAGVESDEFGDNICTDATCEVRSFQPQGQLVRYFNDVHRSRRPASAELPYIRV